MRRMLGIVAVGVASLLLIASPASAARASQGITPSLGGVSGGDYVEGKPSSSWPTRSVAGRESMQQTVTALGSDLGAVEWGEPGRAFSRVGAEQTGKRRGGSFTTNCYISQSATAAQRMRLLSAFVASQDVRSAEVMSWRIEATDHSHRGAGSRSWYTWG